MFLAPHRGRWCKGESKEGDNSVCSNRPTRHSQEAIRRIRSTGANVRTQAPLINHVNADPATWASMWRLQTRLGAIPYYMFVERDTGARKYFEVRFENCLQTYSQ